MNSDNMRDSSMKDVMQDLSDVVSAVTYAVEAGTLDEVLQRIAEAARRLVKARYGALGIPDGYGGLKYFKVSGLTNQQIAQMKGHEPVGHGLLGAIMEERKVIRLAKMTDDPRSVGFCEGHPIMTSFLGAPIQVGQQLFGMLYLSDREDGEPFDQQDQWLVEAIAGYAALAISGVQLSIQQSQIKLLEERERISMELHDGIIQSLYAIGMHLDLVRTGNQAHPEDLIPAISSLNTVIDDIRSYIMDLRTSTHDKRTIRECIVAIVERADLGQSAQFEIEALETRPPVSAVTFEAMCQIAFEAVSNTMRHADASRIVIRAFEEADHFSIVVQDDGIGFDLDRAGSTGLGLKNIRQRAKLHQGDVFIETAPGQGTTVTVSMPL